MTIMKVHLTDVNLYVFPVREIIHITLNLRHDYRICYALLIHLLEYLRNVFTVEQEGKLGNSTGPVRITSHFTR